jgi:hypothetical protein
MGRICARQSEDLRCAIANQADATDGPMDKEEIIPPFYRFQIYVIGQEILASMCYWPVRAWALPTLRALEAKHPILKGQLEIRP